MQRIPAPAAVLLILKSKFKCAAMAAVFGAMIPWSGLAQPQDLVPIFDYTKAWKYEQGGTNLPPEWINPNYEDSAWPLGEGVLGYPANENIFGVAPIVPGLNRYVPGSTTVETTTYFFRTTFDFTNSVQGQSLYFNCVLDDGMVVYLNGTEIQRVAIPAGAVSYATLANRVTEVSTNGIEFFIVAPSNLLMGANTLAVEVHQGDALSSDAIFGMALASLPSTPLLMTSQPADVSVGVAQPFALSVGISGNPAGFQWQRDNRAGGFTNLPGAISASYQSFFSAATSVTYRVVASNALGSVTSRVASVSVLANSTGPLVLSATVLEESAFTNRVELLFNETLLANTVHSLTTAAVLTNGTYNVVMCSSNISVNVSNSIYTPGVFPTPGPLPKVTLRMNTTNWLFRSNYYVVLNRIKDNRSNGIAPNNVVAVRWPFTTNVISTNALWDYHNQALADATVYETPWNTVEYDPVTNGWWQSSNAVLWHDPLVTNPGTNVVCMGQAAAGNEIAYSRQPVLLRKGFDWPSNVNTNVTLTLKYLLEDGAIFYLNGAELHRANIPGAGALGMATRAFTNYTSLQCATVTLSASLRPGSNVFAAALCQSFPEGDADLYFAASLDIASSVGGGCLPEDGSPAQLAMESFSTNDVRVSWPSNIYNYALMTGTNVMGPWVQAQPGMNNPYTNKPALGLERFYRLQKLP